MYGRKMGNQAVHRRKLAWGGVGVLMLLVVGSAACADQPHLTSADRVGPSSTSVASTSPTGSSGERPSDVFTSLAAAVAPLPVFAPTALPEGAVLADRWSPVLQENEPGSYQGPARSNPYVAGSGADAEAQVVYRVGDGWLVIIENFHGDLGDVAGESVGTIEASHAEVFSVNGGELVQWSTNGCWYGVFGRGLSRGVILAAALGMKVMP